MSKESYARGFCKVAEAAGVDPTQLAKYAWSISGKKEPDTKSSFGSPNNKPIAEKRMDYAPEMSQLKTMTRLMKLYPKVADKLPNFFVPEGSIQRPPSKEYILPSGRGSTGNILQTR